MLIRVLLFLLTMNCLTLANNLEYQKIGNGKPTLMILAGMHGNERSGIEFLRNFPNIDIKKGSVVIIPEGNRKAIELEKRTAPDKIDLNRSFYEGNDYFETKRILEIIEKEKPSLILDLHESKNPNNGTDAVYYLGNSAIYTDSTFDMISSLLLESDLSLIGSAPKGSLNKYASEVLNIPTITIETAKTESVNQRKERYLKFINSSLEFLEMK